MQWIHPHPDEYIDLCFFQQYATKENGNINYRYRRIQHSKYVQYTRFWLDIFNRHQIHFVNGDMLTKDPASELTKIESFLGLRHYVSEDNFIFNNTKGFFCWRETDGSEKCESKNKGRPHPIVDEGLMLRLSLYFRTYNRKFFDMIGEDFG